VTVQPASIVVELAEPAGASSTNSDRSGQLPASEVEVRVVEAAVAVQQPAPRPQAVTQSQGS
jgi:uncharacterized lipoprotein